MSIDEDADLRELVAHTLENNGVLGKIKAELRAKVFMVLEAHDRSETSQLPVENEKLRKFVNTKEGRLITGLVREFLEFFNLEYTLAVFDPETSFGDRYQGRANLAEELKVSDTIINNNISPLLSHLMASSQGMPKLDFGSINEEKAKKSRTSPEISPRSLSSGSRSTSPRISRIPQLATRDKKNNEKTGDNATSKAVVTETSLADDTKTSFKMNKPDLSLSLNDDDILAEFMQPRQSRSRENIESSKKTFLLDEDPSKDSRDDQWLMSLDKNGSRKLGSSQGTMDIDEQSPDMKALAEIDRRINELGFGLPPEEKSAGADDYNDSYADDFNPSTHSDADPSIQEELDTELSLGSYKSEGSRTEDLVTSDRVVSPIDFKDLDYGEEVENF